MDSIKLCMIGVLCVFVSLILKESKSGLSFAVKTACSVFVFVSVVSSLTPLIDLASTTASESAISVYMPMIFKSLGIAYAGALGADICRDCGESSIASNIELAAKTEMVLLSMPILKDILALAKDLIE